MPEQFRLALRSEFDGRTIIRDLKFVYQNNDWYYYELIEQPGIVIQSKDGPFGEIGFTFTARIKELTTMGVKNGSYEMIHVARIEPLIAFSISDIGVLFY